MWTSFIYKQQNVAILQFHRTIQPLEPIFEQDGRHLGFLVITVDLYYYRSLVTAKL